ncbi:MAG: glycosyltransferase family 2 protein, partial [Nannocystaceae bacterium]
VVARVRAFLPDVIVVDDGSDAPGRDAVAQLAQAGLVHAVHRAQNGGKGAAVKTGFATAAELGFTHVLQVDADGQHHLEDIPNFLDAALDHPNHLILGAPIYDETAPTSRLVGRKITLFWTHIETHGRVIHDPMCGFRIYPVAAVMQLGKLGERMDFDIEIAVRLVWLGVPVVNLPTKVRYLGSDEGGVSHFDMLWDNLRISWLHTRLATFAVLIYPWLRLARALGLVRRPAVTSS